MKTIFTDLVGKELNDEGLGFIAYQVPQGSFNIPVRIHRIRIVSISSREKKLQLPLIYPIYKLIVT